MESSGNTAGWKGDDVDKVTDGEKVAWEKERE